MKTEIEKATSDLFYLSQRIKLMNDFLMSRDVLDPDGEFDLSKDRRISVGQGRLVAMFVELADEIDGVAADLKGIAGDL